MTTTPGEHDEGLRGADFDIRWFTRGPGAVNRRGRDGR